MLPIRQGTAADCKAGAVGSCLNLAARPRAAVRYDTAAETCRLYLAYDSSAQAGDGEVYMKGRLRAFDITEELAPALEFAVDSLDDSAALNDFNTTVTADYFSPAAGLFFYRQDAGDPCSTTFRGLVSTDGENFVELNQPISGPFPSMRFHLTDGLGHYVAPSTFTRPGRLFPSWSEPVPTVAECVDCQGVDYALRVLGAGVRP